MESLGFPLVVAPDKVAGELDKNNFVFLFAPNYHPAFKRVGPIRKELGVRSLFNLMRKACDKAGLDLIALVGLNTSEERLAEYAAVARGYVYFVSVLGTTGMPRRRSAR